MYEDIQLYGLFELRMAEQAVERRLRARQLGEAWEGLPQGDAQAANSQEAGAEACEAY
jgi:hypothetical protein